MSRLRATLISVLVAALYCEASPHHFKLQEFPLGVVGGRDAKEGEFPYMVQVFRGDVYQCAGAIIAEKWILTSAVCATSKIEFVAYGTITLYRLDPTNKKRNIKKSYPHPKFYYDDISGEKIPVYDVGLLELEESIPYDSQTQPLKLASDNDVPLYVPGTLAGWGSDADILDFQTSVLQKVQLELLHSRECSRALAELSGFHGFNGTHNLCSEYNYKGQCAGDSGSPFVINGLGYGVASWYIRPCTISPGAFSRITNPEYRSFIREIAGV